MLPLHRSPRLGERHRGAKSVNLFRRRRFNIHTQYILYICTFHHLCVRKLSQSIRKDGIFSTDFGLFELCAKIPSEIEIKRELKIVVFHELFFCTQSRVKLRKVTQQFEQHWGIFPASRLKWADLFMRLCHWPLFPCVRYIPSEILNPVFISDRGFSNQPDRIVVTDFNFRLISSTKRHLGSVSMLRHAKIVALSCVHLVTLVTHVTQQSPCPSGPSGIKIFNPRCASHLFCSVVSTLWPLWPMWPNNPGVHVINMT